MTTVTGYVRDQAGDLLANATVHLIRRDTGALLGSAVSGDGGEAKEGDADYASVSLLLHCDGTDGSTIFTDTSGTPKTVTPSGDAHIETDQAKFGTASAYFDGTGDYLTVSNDGAFNFGTGDFTIEAWVRLANASAYRFLLGSAASGYMMVAFNYQANAINVGVGNVGWTANFSGHNISADTWTHVALSRSGTSHRCFVGGTQIGSTVTDSTSYTFPTGGMAIGYQTGGSPFYGYLDDIRITKGVARYTENFTPPAAAFLDYLSIAAKPLGLYSTDTTYSGEVQRIVCAPDAWDPIANDLIDRIILP